MIQHKGVEAENPQRSIYTFNIHPGGATYVLHGRLRHSLKSKAYIIRFKAANLNAQPKPL